MIGYNDKMDADEQISMEEQIAGLIFGTAFSKASEEDMVELGRRILLVVLAKFRPDLVEEGHASE